MTKKLQKKVVKKPETKKAEPSKKAEVSKKAETPAREFDVVDEDVVAELGTEEDILLEPDAEIDDPEPILDEEDT